tara:strand:+ start:592 stop:1236 length:645 start_codon:yes stop_codon:yes gene_type:complete
MSKEQEIISKLNKLQKTKKFKKAKKIVEYEYSKVNITSYTPLEITGIVLLSILGLKIFDKLLTFWQKNTKNKISWIQREEIISKIKAKAGETNYAFGKKNKKNNIKKATENVSIKLKKEGYKPLEIVAIILIVLFGIHYTIKILVRIVYEIKYARMKFGKKKKKVVKKKKVSVALKRLCKKHKVRLTVKRGKKRVYKSEKVLKKQVKNKMKKKK